MGGWYVEGEEQEASVRELEGSSDRTAAIVATTFVEGRLTAVVKARLAQEPRILDELFRTSGPLGSLSTKIDLALLIDVISKDAHHDLTIMKNIRNVFAHDLRSVSFEAQKIRCLCQNIKLIETLVRPMNDDTWHPGAPLMLQITNYPDCLNNPRDRFLTAARLFVAALSPRHNKISPISSMCRI